MKKYRIQLHVTQSNKTNRDYESKNFHIFDGNRSLCKKYTQNTDDYETDYYIKKKVLSASDVKDIIDNHSKYICPKCANNFKVTSIKDLTI